MEMHPFYLFLDPFLIWFYRLTGNAWADFFLGTLVLACLTLLIGEVTVSLAFRFIRKPLDQSAAEAAKYQNLSMDALKAGDKAAYTAANKLANDAFGKSFFQQATLSAAFLWPVFFALAWMQSRFLDMEFPLPFSDWSLGYIGMFLLLYIPAVILFKRVKHKLPYFRGVKEILDSYQNHSSVLAPANPAGPKGSIPEPEKL
jgi:hypothetical protein